jgi:hypothetical protein
MVAQAALVEQAAPATPVPLLAGAALPEAPGDQPRPVAAEASGAGDVVIAATSGTYQFNQWEECSRVLRLFT